MSMLRACNRPCHSEHTLTTRRVWRHRCTLMGSPVQCEMHHLRARHSQHCGRPWLPIFRPVLELLM